MKSSHVWMLVYVVAVLVANYTAEMFIELPMFGILSVGTLVFGVTFTARDYVHQLGRKYVYGMIAIAAILALIMSATLAVPWRIVIASFITILIAETADTEVYNRFLRHNWIVRVLASNSVSVPMDSIIFTVIAFAGVFSVGMIAEIVYADVIVKFTVGLCVALIRYMGISNVKNNTQSA